MRPQKKQSPRWHDLEFLRARLAEDEQVARAASDPNCYFDLLGGSKAEERFLAVFDPARVLREIEAKRQILDAYESAVLDDQRDPARGRATAAVRDALAETLRLLALAYSDHPDFQSGWKP